jgi:hypothetical protein
MKFGPMNLNSIYFIEFKGRLRMDIWSNIEGTWVNWTSNNFPKIENNDFEKASMSFGFEFESNTKADAFYLHI